MEFRTSLFWDINPQKIDFTENKRYVIERVLNFGNEKDYLALKKRYTENDIRQVLLRERINLDKKSLNFWSDIYDTPRMYA